MGKEFYTPTSLLSESRVKLKLPGMYPYEFFAIKAVEIEVSVPRRLAKRKEQIESVELNTFEDASGI